MEKKCTNCLVVKDLSEFYKNGKARDRRASQCKKCTDAANRRHRQKYPQRGAALALKYYYANPRYQKLRTVKFLYGLTEAAYDRLVLESKGQCAICLTKTKLVIDHDHATGEIRGMLCGKCNAALGFFKDSALILNSALAYLSK